jgi:hypothetical protein
MKCIRRGVRKKAMTVQQPADAIHALHAGG